MRALCECGANPEHLSRICGSARGIAADHYDRGVFMIAIRLSDMIEALQHLAKMKRGPSGRARVSDRAVLRPSGLWPLPVWPVPCRVDHSDDCYGFTRRAGSDRISNDIGQACHRFFIGVDNATRAARGNFRKRRSGSRDLVRNMLRGHRIFSCDVGYLRLQVVQSISRPDDFARHVY